MLSRDMYGACLREKGMVDLVCREVAGAAARAPALTFLAAIARDHGAMPQAVMLFRQGASSEALQSESRQSHHVLSPSQACREWSSSMYHSAHHATATGVQP